MRALILTALLATPVQAQTSQCMGLPDALASLATRYQEQPRVSGLLPTGQLLLVTVNERGDWSMLRVNPDGLACLVAFGEAFALTEAPKPGVMN